MTNQQDENWAFGQQIQNEYCLPCEYGNNSFTPDKRFIAEVVYALPFGHGQSLGNNINKYANGAIGGWKLSAVITLQSGQFYTPSFNTFDPSNAVPAGGGRPDAIPGVSVVPAGRNSNNWVNLAAFAIPGCPFTNPVCPSASQTDVGRFGTAGINTLEGPPIRDADLAVMKDFHTTERFLWQIEVQAANALNHPALAAPSGNISTANNGGAIIGALNAAPTGRQRHTNGLRDDQGDFLMRIVRGRLVGAPLVGALVEGTPCGCPCGGHPRGVPLRDPLRYTRLTQGIHNRVDFLTHHPSTVHPHPKELTMRRIKVALILTILLVLGSNAHAQTPAAFRVLFGVNDTAVTRWDGSLKVMQAGQYSLEPWRFEGVDNIDGELFHFSTHPGFFQPAESVDFRWPMASSLPPRRWETAASFPSPPRKVISVFAPPKFLMGRESTSWAGEFMWTGCR